MTFIKKIYTVLLSSILAIAAGCDSDFDSRTTLHFIGDSLIARWDLQSSFSSLITYNRGCSGTGIAYIENLAGSFSGKNIVVEIGTNDNLMMADEDQCRRYAVRYIEAIEALGADIVYLYQVLPRDFDGDRPDINSNIRTFNTIVESIVADNPRVIYLKVYDEFLGSDGTIYLDYYSDGLHLSAHGYEILTRKLFDRL